MIPVRGGTRLKREKTSTLGTRGLSKNAFLSITNPGRPSLHLHLGRRTTLNRLMRMTTIVDVFSFTSLLLHSPSFPPPPLAVLPRPVTPTPLRLNSTSDRSFTPNLSDHHLTPHLLNLAPPPLSIQLRLRPRLRLDTAWYPTRYDRAPTRPPREPRTMPVNTRSYI
jgi:hypothetical protein